MEQHRAVRERLLHLEQLLRDQRQWQETAPAAEAFNSDQPFCMDTLTPHEWLQWVLLPRMHALIDAGQPLPESFNVAPYYEVALAEGHPGREELLAALQALDLLFSGER